ncbi:toxin glutamine deamidase domain-containing protein, partial [Pseudomonas sp. BCRC 81390]|uniref:toxin glutamine deamidase domain-containing protein n=1 Tax=Pseudomonas sp. BCRC 81390 TaxID=3054778 RepID=UPI002597922E
RTEGQLKADKEARAELDARGIPAPGEGASEAAKKAYQEKLVATEAYQRIMGKYGTSGDYQKVTQAVTAALQGLAGGNLGGALAGASAPYLAGVIRKVAGNNENVRVMAHAVLGAVVAQAQGNSAAAGAAGAATGELIAARIYPDKSRDQLSEEEKQTISALATLASGLAGAATGGGLTDAVAAGQAGRNAAENNALSDIAEALAAGKTPEVVAEEHVKAENERYRQQNCAGLSSDACSVKMYKERREHLNDTLSTGADFVPVIGVIKSYAEAESALDYLAATIGIFPGVGVAAGKAIKAAETALKRRDLAEASRLINETSQYIASGAKATDVVDQTAGSIKNVNPGYPGAGRTHNCVNCSIATDATLAGNPASALPINHTKGVPLSVLEKQFSSKFGPVTAPENIAQQMANSGNGARGIVFGSYGPGQPGHVFNVVNQDGVVRFLDGQTGKPANLSDFKTLQLLRTN